MTFNSKVKQYLNNNPQASYGDAMREMNKRAQIAKRAKKSRSNEADREEERFQKMRAARPDLYG